MLAKPLPPPAMPLSPPTSPISFNTDAFSTSRAQWDALTQAYSPNGSAALDDCAAFEQPSDLIYDPDVDYLEDQDSANSCDRAKRDGLRSEVRRGSVEHVKAYYKQHGYMPSLENPREEERQQTLQRYDLESLDSFPSVDALTELTRDIFNVESCIITLVLNDRVQFVSTAGATTDPGAPAACLKLNESLCPHSQHKSAEQGCWVLGDCSADYRFARIPLVQDGGLRFFASANINLTAPSSADKLAVGSLCLLDPKPRDGLSQGEQQALKRFSELCAKEFELAFQAQRAEVSRNRSIYATDLFRSLLVYPSRTLSTIKERCSVDNVARDLAHHTKSDYAFILDTRQFNYHPPAVPPVPIVPLHPGLKRQTSTTSSRLTSAREEMERLWSSVGSSRRLDPKVHGQGTISLVDYYCGDDKQGKEWDEARREWAVKVEDEGGGEELGGKAAVTAALTRYHVDEQTRYASLDKALNPLSPILPDGTRATICCPIFDNEGEPALLLVCGSYEMHRVYEENDEVFVGGIGAIVLGSMLQAQLQAADQAKLAFVSQISHELRTPLNSTTGMLELIRTVSSPEALGLITSFLDVADVSLDNLKDILEDCLEYSKLSNHSRTLMPTPTLVESTLEQLVLNVMVSCTFKAQKTAAVKKQDDGSSDETVLEEIGLFFESTLPPDLVVMVDVGGLKRILLNLVGNAIKFTDVGTITVRLSEAPSSTALRTFRLEVVDQGCGMSDEFVNEGLFTAFKQASSFSSGAGLGVSLISQIVGRMKGKMSFASLLGKGTTATVLLPLEVVHSSGCSSPALSFSESYHSGVLAPTHIALSDVLAGHASPSLSYSAPMSVDNDDEAASPRRQVEPRPALAVKQPAPKLPRDAPISVPPEFAAVPIPSTLRVLVVDDNPLARRVLVTWLKTKKYVYAEASGGADAIELYKTFRPNLVWCDIQMPEVDGIEATYQMRQYEEEQCLARARIVALSGLDAKLGNNSHVLENGQVDRWIVKGGPSLRQLNADLIEFEAVLIASSDSGYSEATWSPTSEIDALKY